MEFSSLIPDFEWQKVGNLTTGLDRVDLGYEAVHFLGGDQHQHLGEEGCEEMFIRWKDNDVIAAIRIGENSIDAKAVNHLSRLLQSNDSILYFSMYDNVMDKASVEAFAQVLAFNKTMVGLQLVHAKIDAVGAEILAAELENNNRTLLQLDLSMNIIQNAGAKAFARALKVNDILTTLCLATNEIGEDGAQALVEALKVNYTLCICDISSNPITMSGSQAVQDLVERNLNELRNAVKDCSDNAKEGPLRKAKLVFIGKNQAGKSELISSLKGLGFNEEYHPTEGVKVTQVQTRLSGEAWYATARAPSSTFGMQFLSRFANVKLDHRVELIEKKEDKGAIGFAGLKQKKNRRGSVQQRRGSVNQKRGAAAAGTDGDGRNSVASRQSRRSSVAMSVLNAIIGEKDALDPIKRAGALGKVANVLAHPFKRQKNVLLDDADFIFWGENERYDSVNKPVYSNDELDKLFDVHVLAKARRERDFMGFNIVELSGNRAFYTMHHAFLTETSVYCLVFNMFNLVNENDIESQKDEIRYLNYWLKVVKYHSPEAALMVVGTHSGNVPKEKYGKVESYISRLVFPEIHKEHAKKKEQGLKANSAVEAANEFAKDLEAENPFQNGGIDKKIKLVVNEKDRRLFFAVELADGSGVDKVRASIDEAATTQKYFSTRIPIQWLKFLDALRTDSPNYFCKPDRVKALAYQNLENDEAEMGPALKMFHELGYIIHLTEIEQLKDTVITDTLSFYKKIFKMVFTKELSMFNFEDANKEGLQDDLEETLGTGIISNKLLDYLWISKNENPTVANEGKHFLMEYCQLTLIIAQYKFNNTKAKYIIPALIPEDVQLIRQTRTDFGDGLGLRAKFSFKGFLTLGVFERLVCLCIQYASSQPKSLPPIMAMGWCQISFGTAYVFRLERMADDIMINIIEAKKKPHKLVNNIEKMLYRIKQFLGQGFIWETMLYISVTPEQVVPYIEAREQKMAPWFGGKESKDEDAE